MKCCEIHSGMLNQRVTLQRQVNTDLGAGATEVTYTTYASVWGLFKPLSGGEVMYAMRVDATTRNRLVIRYRTGILEGDRAVIGDRAYNIRYIQDPEFKHAWLVIDLDGGVPYVGTA